MLLILILSAVIVQMTTTWKYALEVNDRNLKTTHFFKKKVFRILYYKRLLNLVDLIDLSGAENQGLINNLYCTLPKCNKTI